VSATLAAGREGWPSDTSTGNGDGSSSRRWTDSGEATTTTSARYHLNQRRGLLLSPQEVPVRTPLVELLRQQQQQQPRLSCYRCLRRRNFASSVTGDKSKIPPSAQSSSSSGSAPPQQAGNVSEANANVVVGTGTARQAEDLRKLMGESLQPAAGRLWSDSDVLDGCGGDASFIPQLSLHDNDGRSKKRVLVLCTGASNNDEIENTLARV